MQNIKEMLGKMVYVSVTGNFFYEAKLLGYGAYGSDPNYKTYCVQITKENGYTFVDYFLKLYTKEDYEAWKSDYYSSVKYPFGRCQYCEKEFNSELINEYEISHCPWCGEKISKLI